MFKIIPLLLLSANMLFSLELSINKAKEKSQDYSILNIKDANKFLCQESKDDYDNIISITCAFSNQPTKKIPKISNSFFNIDTQTRGKTFFLIIKPTKKMKLYSVIFDLKNENTIFNANIDLSSYWVVVGYEKDVPFLDQQKVTKDKSINFPVTFAKDDYPYVGSLDLKGNPLYLKKMGDVSDYIKIKKVFEDAQYENCLTYIGDTIKEYPDSLFMSELLYYKIKVEDKLQNFDEVVNISKKFLKEYASDENVAEVLSLLAKAYDKVEQTSDADYFYDRLFSEHSDSIYSKWGMVYRAESLDNDAQNIKAQELYKRVLNETDNVDVGVYAGFDLLKSLVSTAKYKEAKEYALKLLKLKPDFFGKRFNESLSLANNFADNEHYDIASDIAKVLLSATDKNNEYYEELLKNCAIWLGKSGDKKGSGEYLNRYIDEFKNGSYIEDIKVAKDTLFFELDDVNSSQKLIEYDKLMQEYSGDSIAKKALYEKAKLLNHDGRFGEVLELESALRDLDETIYVGIDDIIKEAAIGSMQNSLKNNECLGVLNISSKYKIELSNEWDDGVYECAMKGADFELAKKMASKNIKTTDLEFRKKWLYRYIRVDFATGNYSNVLEASKELITLIKGNNSSSYKDIYRYIFDTYQRLENHQKMIESIIDIQSVFGQSYVDIERYAAIVNIGSLKSDDNLVINYGKKVLDIEKNSSQKPHSPNIEFAMYDAYINKKEYKSALDVISSLDKLELKNRDRSRQKYLLGNIYTKLWKDSEAKAAYEDAIKADENSAWAKLANSALKN